MQTDSRIINNIIKKQTKSEKKLSNFARKQNGTFFTNQVAIVENIIGIIDFENDILNKKILEPSVGHGILLISVLEKLIQYHNNSSIVEQFIQNNLYFVDIDKSMIENTEQNINDWFLSTFKTSFNGVFNSFCYDFTQKEIKPDLFSQSQYPFSNLLSTFDYVIGNPPYVTLYGRRDKKQSEAQRVFYLNNYKQFPDNLKNGKLNYVMLFLEHGLDLLKKGGKLSYIIDLSFFETAYKYTRKYLLDNTSIISLEYNIKEFEVASGQIILKIKNGKNSDNQVKIIDNQNNKSLIINQEVWNDANDEYKFRYSFDKTAKQILEKINRKNNPTLRNLFPKKNLRTCVMLLNMEDKFIFKENNLSDKLKVYPYYKGSKGLSEKYETLKNGSFFYYNKELQDKINDDLKIELEKQGIKNKKRLGLGETVIYDNPKVFIRQSAKKLIATYTEEPGSANNSLYVFSLRDSSEKSKNELKFICGLLNSNLFTFWAQNMNVIRYSKGKQPQIKISDLYKLPIIQDIEIKNQIIRNVDNLYKDENKDIYILNIDELIYNYYQIREEEKEYIEAKIINF